MKNIVCLWSCPRNISTALMYSFAQRHDTIVHDEPLYAHYLRVSGANHPGRDAVLNNLESDGNKVVNDVILKKSNKWLFHKLMTHFLVEINKNFLNLVHNIIFIRNPYEIIHSYSKVIANPSIDDIGIKSQYYLYQHLIKIGNPPIVLDSKYLLKSPEFILKKICSILKMPFEKKMLKWKKGGILEDGVWAKYWYHNVHNSTCFLPYKKNNIELSSNNLDLAEQSLLYYNFLTCKSIKDDTKI